MRKTVLGELYYGNQFAGLIRPEWTKDKPMTTAVEKPIDALAVTADQLDLIRRTIAKDATPDELKLYLFDCHRQGVHPLDKLIHFTKRSGKYTPITSIDFMRIRAAETGEYAGSDDADFHDTEPGDTESPGFIASVTVWRLVQGTRCPFTATARWSEYKPEQNDFMWRKMPHTMLGKCAEALALRKGFPRQLAGLYAKEELDQAEHAGVAQDKSAGSVTRRMDARGDAVQGNEPGHFVRPDVAAETVPPAPSDNGPDLGADLPPGARRIVRVGPGKASAAGEITFDNGESFLCWKAAVVKLAKEWQADGTPCVPEIVKSQAGNPRVESLTAYALIAEQPL